MQVTPAAYQGSEPYTFVCYAHADAEAVYKEIHRLYDMGLHVWYDEGITPGSEWSESLAHHIEGCEFFLYFISRNSVQSENCRRELNFALDQRKPVVVVHLEPTDVPAAIKLSLSHRQAILKHDLSESSYERKLGAALDLSVSNKQSEIRSQHNQDLRRQDLRRPVWLFSGFAVIVILGVVLAWHFNSFELEETPLTLSIAPIQVF